MSRYRCDCGDTECPSCGSAQGTYIAPDIEGPPANCEGCGQPRTIDEDDGDTFFCAKCIAEIRILIRQTR